MKLFTTTKGSFGSIYLGLFLLISIAIILSKSSLSLYSASIHNIIYDTSLLIPVVIATQLLLIVGYYDLSVGAIISLSGVLTTFLVVQSGSLLIGVVAGFGGAVLLGYFNGLLVTKLKIHSLIVTIASSSIIIGITYLITSGSTIVGLPLSFSNLAHGQFLGIDYPIYLGVICVMILFAFSKYLLLFRRLYQTGSNVVAAQSCGINTDRYICLTYVFSGISASVVGMLEISRTMSATPVADTALPLSLISACVVGGSSLNGGKGDVAGAVLGLVLLRSIDFIIVLYGLDIYWRYLGTGLLLLGITIINRKQIATT